MAAPTLAPDPEEIIAAGGTTTSRLSAPREEVRLALLDAVANLIQRYGYRKTSVEDIAREAGVSRATAYLYFANKDDLVMGWVEERDRQRLEYLRTCSSIADGGNALGRVADLLLARVLTRFDDAQPYTQGLDEFLAALRARVLIQRDRHHEAEALLIADILSDGVRKGEFPSLSDPLTTARLLILGTNSLLPYSLSARQLGERAEVEARARGLIDLLLCGVRYGSGDKNKAAMPAVTEEDPEASCHR